MYAIKTGLSKLCNNRVLIRRIKKVVKIATKMISEFSIMMNQLFQENKIEDMNLLQPPYLRQYLSGLKNKRRIGTKPLDPKYKIQREKANIQLYDCLNMAHVMENSTDVYERCVGTNIVTHAEPRSKKFTQKILNHRDPKNIINFLFEAYPKKTLLNPEEMEIVDEFTARFSSYMFNGSFHEQPWQMMSDFFIQVRNELSDAGIKSFAPFPIFNPGSHHIMLTPTAFIEILVSCKLAKPQAKLASIETKRTMFKNYFNVKKYENENVGKEFDYIINTDGVSASIHMIRPKKEEGEKKKFYFDPRKKSIICGLDPGAKLMGGGCIHKEEYPGVHFKFRYTSKQYHHDNYYHSRRQKINKWTGDMVTKIETDRKENFGGSTNKDKNFERFTDFSLKHLNEKQRLLEKSKFPRTRFNSYLTTQSSISKLASIIAPKNKNVLVVFGDVKISPIIRGYIKTPIARLLRELNQRKNVYLVTVDEYFTTKKCNKCYEIMDNPSIWRDFKCKECSQIFYFKNRKQKLELHCNNCNSSTLEKISKQNPTKTAKHYCSKCFRQYSARINNGKCTCDGKLLQQNDNFFFLKKYCKKCNLLHFTGENCSTCQGKLAAIEPASKHRYKYCGK